MSFTADMDSFRRVLPMAAADKRMSVYTLLVREGIRWHTIGGMPKVDVVDELHRVGIEAGLGENDIQNALAAAVESPFEPVPPGRSRPDKQLIGPDWRSRCTSAATLQSQTFPPVAHVVPGLVAEGLTLLAGKPKIGKSWLALDICLAVAGNRVCLGNLSPAGGDVLYVALEDNPRRLQRRIGKLLASPWPARLMLATSWSRLDKGGVEEIALWADSVTLPRLVVLDTLAGIRPVRPTPGYGEDYEALAPLHRWANEKAIAVLVLHHMRKMAADDPVDTVSGTLGLTGCADTILVLARSSAGTTLYCRGRDIEEAEHAIQFSSENCRWTILGDAANVRRSDERQRVIAALADGQMSIAELVAATGMVKGNLEKLLHFMVRDGDIDRIERGVYGPVSAKGR